jgi:predicted MFS family arabinose efflux permease
MVIGQRRTPLAVLAFVAFCFVYSTLALVPVLLQLAEEFDISVGTAGLTTTAYGVASVVLSLVVGPYSDRYGRKRFLVIGMGLLGVATIAAALAPSFALLIAGRTVAGIGAALAASSITASVADLFAYAERGRAMAVVTGATSLAMLAGVPAAGILADATTWRASLALVGGLALLASLLVAACLPPSSPSAGMSRTRDLYLRVLRQPSAVLVLVAGFLAALAWSAWAVYMVVFFQIEFDLSQSMASTVALSAGVGTLIGSQVGGRLGDRRGMRRTLRITLLASSVVILLLTAVPVGLVGAVGLNLVFTALVGSRTVTHTALTSEQLPEARGTIMAMFTSSAAAASILAAAIGGMLIDAVDFWLLGLVSAITLFIATMCLRVPPSPQVVAAPTAGSTRLDGIRRS